MCRISLFGLLFCALLLTSTTINSGTTVAAVPPKEKTSACTLLTGSQIKLVQGEVAKETKSSSRVGGHLAISQCLYILPTFSKSVSVELTQNNSGSGARDRVREYWDKNFHHTVEKEKRERPIPVQGIGDEAFWVGNGIVSALYVLKNDSVIRISIGGPAEGSVKIKKIKQLAEHALKNLE